MKKLLWFLNSLILIIFYSCGEKNEHQTPVVKSELYKVDTTELKTIPIKDDSPFQLEYNFIKGEKLLYRLTTISETFQKVILDTIVNNKINQEITYLIEFKPQIIEADGTFESDVNIIGVKLNADVNGEKVSYDALKDKDSLQILRYAEFASLYNNPFSVRFTKNGEITEIFRADKISNKFLKIRNADTVDLQTKNLVRDDMISSVLKPLMGQIIRKLTEKTLAVDSSWISPQPPVPLMVFKLNYNNKYRISSVEKLDEDKLVVIEAGMDYKIEGNPNYKEGGITYRFNKPISRGDGKIYFNISKGRIQKSQTKSSTEFSFTMEAETPQGKQKGRREEIVSNTNILELIKQ